jgi:hypothetical protein
MLVERGRSWGESFWSNISDREVEEIAAKRVGFPIYLKERKERPGNRDTVFYCYRKDPVIPHETTWVRGEIYDKTGGSKDERSMAERAAA